MSLNTVRVRRRLLVVLAVPVLLYLGLFAFRTVRWQLWVWLPTMVMEAPAASTAPDSERHIIFLVTDHYEPGSGPEGVARNARWLEGYRLVADRHVDSTGRRPQYSWFYPYDNREAEVLIELNRMAYEGYGEVELHWHHPDLDNETFPGKLERVLEWFQSYGALVTSGPRPVSSFAFIHGNWALDASSRACRVSRELEFLQDRGCYADFTFSTIGTTCQPRMINQVYYADPGPEPKSYDQGRPAAVGTENPSGFMIFLGPLTFDWLRVKPSYGAIGEIEPNRRQIESWLDAGVHVSGRPEWIFVKVYAHGIQTRTIDSGAMAGTLEILEEICAERGSSLHYMTAREAYNVVKAAEDGLHGNPAQYRDYRIPPPANRFFHTEVPVRIERVTADEAVYSVLE